MKISWGTCMPEEVAAWLHTPPCLNRHTSPWGGGNGIPSMWLFISLMCSPSFILGYRGWSFFNSSFFILLCRHKKSFL
jgi:hypothetical protein